MKYLDLTLPTPEANLACDEALLDGAEMGVLPELLRFWEPEGFFVVVGYGNRVGTEVNSRFCVESGIPILRRCSGGGTVLQGPGCFNYSLILKMEGEGREWAGSISGTNQFVMARHRQILERLSGEAVEVRGQIDLTLGQRKFSGNAQRRRQRALLFHGTFLLRFNLEKVEAALCMPGRQPEYRGGRSHRDFLTGLSLTSCELKKALKEGWGAEEVGGEVPWKSIDALVKEKYSKDEWNLKF